jgi:hypothetical protein
MELDTYLALGRALWADPEDSARMAVETMNAVSLLQLSPEQRLERAAQALLERTRRAGRAANTISVLKSATAADRPFYRLEAESRFVIVALHAGRWSYARLARILEKSVEETEELAWRARIAFSGSRYPSGGTLSGPNCPDYNARRPWTQRFLDEEIGGGKERLFFQNHLMACDSCRGALGRARALIASVDKLLPRFEEMDVASGALKELERALKQSALLESYAKPPSERSARENFTLFIDRRRDVRLALGLAAASFVFIALKAWL